MAEKKEHPIHYKGKDAIGHVAEAQAKGLIASQEIHGAEIPGHIYAGADAARESAIILLLVGCLLFQLRVPLSSSLYLLGVFSFGWLIWKSGRSAWLGWSRLERLHRVLEQERWEIEHNREQEREELTVLYANKGFEGKLLTDVIDVLMADGDRLLRVMVEEELGLTLEKQEHPLKQAAGAAIGCLCSILVCIAAYLFYSIWGIIIGAFVIISLAAFIYSHYEGNDPIPAVIWNLGLGALSLGCVYFLIHYFFP